MAMKRVITSPHRFPERILAYGGGGVGKSRLTLSIARYMPESIFHVIDLDYSMSYIRLLQTEFQDVYDQDNVVVHEIDSDWEQFATLLPEIVAEADPHKDWITVDPTTTTWEMVQAWWTDVVMETNIADHMAQLRKDTNDTKEYAAALADTMQWPAINKQYQERFYRILNRWKGNLILCCEPNELGKQEDGDVKSTYGFVGYKPKGQKTLPHVAATNLFLDHPSKDRWRMTTIKDRGRELVEKADLDDFAVDYLVDIAGWEMEMVRS